MARVKRGFKARRRRKKVLKQTKGYYGRRKNCYTVATEAHDRALKYSYRDRKAKKRDFRSLWIARINGALASFDYTYSRFISDLKNADIQLDRKILANLALEEVSTFEKLVSQIRPQ